MTRLPLFVGEAGPSNVAGVGNYVRSIRSPAAAKDDATLFNLYFLDSHANVKKLTPWGGAGYDYLKPDQINWFRGRSSQMQPLLRPYTPPRKLTRPKKKPSKKPHKKPSKKPAKNPKPHRPIQHQEAELLDDRSSAFAQMKQARRALVDLEKRQAGWWDRLTGAGADDGVATEVEPDDGSGVVENPDDTAEFEEAGDASEGASMNTEGGWDAGSATSSDDVPVDEFARPSTDEGDRWASQGDQAAGEDVSQSYEGGRWGSQSQQTGEQASQDDEFAVTNAEGGNDDMATTEDGGANDKQGVSADETEDGAQGESNALLEAEEDLFEDEGFFEPTKLPDGPTALTPMEAKPNAMVFFHIPLRTAYDAEIDVAPSGKRLRVGQRLEGEGASKTDSGFFEQAILAQGELPVSRDEGDTPVDAFWDGEATAPTTGRPEVKVLAHGHCHISSDCRRVKGVWICFGGGATVRTPFSSPRAVTTRAHSAHPRPSSRLRPRLACGSKRSTPGTATRPSRAACACTSCPTLASASRRTNSRTTRSESTSPCCTATARSRSSDQRAVVSRVLS